jgi:hypothetical protein
MRNGIGTSAANYAKHANKALDWVLLAPLAAFAAG